MFTRTDLATVTSPKISRDNWRQHPEVLKLIQRYALDVAALSPLTDKMQSPEIAAIELVGAVLGHDQTPVLNQESSAGRVQFFQVSFKEGKTKINLAGKWKKIFQFLLLTAFGIIGTALIIFIVSQLSLFTFKKTQESVAACSTNRQKPAYSEELRTLRTTLVAELNSLPAWSTFKEARLNCIGGRMSVQQQEQRLLTCLSTVRNRTQNMPLKSRPNLKQIQACATTLCKKNLPHLYSSCKRF
ncbi:MAG: hypothetical protein H8E38_02065 [SAR324 cluster bacterium]|nr:hypothetical protein [SAR324 cluster bacterium]MBL7034922.1 hypothetical protein [SAR324 cluster bacterium]